MAKRLTKEAIKEKLALISPNIEILTISQDLKRIDCSCLKCSYVWNASWDKLSRGRGCHKCSKTLKLTLDEVKKRVANILPNVTIISKSYTNNKTKIECKCILCGYEWDTTAKNLLSGCGCFKCGIQKSSSKRQYTKDKIQSALSHIKVIDRDNELIEWQCKECKTIHKTRYSLLQQGKTCSVCRGYKTRKGYSQDNALSLLSQVNKKVRVIGDYFGSQLPIKSQCVKCGYEWYPKFNDLQQGSGCPKCANQISQIEKDFLISFTGWERDRKILGGKEIDAYFPKQKIAVEVNGAYWHSEAQGKDRDYHLNKTTQCELQGIKLYHFFDSEVLDKKDICKSMINKACNNIARIYARDCLVKSITPQQAQDFCNSNHIQGHCVDKVRYGLFYGDEIVSVMTFGKSRYDKRYEWELLRFCSKVGYLVVGGASKLLKHFERDCKPKSLISYGNRRWCNKDSNVYKVIGFEYKGNTKPNYYYEKAGKLYNRQNFQRHKLDRIFSYNFNSILTENEIMSLYGYSRIYDCGNLIYVKEYNG